MVKIDLKNMTFEWVDSFECNQVKEVLAAIEHMNVEVERVKEAYKIINAQRKVELNEIRRNRK